MNRLWIVLGSAGAAVALGAGTFNVVGLLAHEEVIERATFDATGVHGVDIRVENGSVEVVGTGGDEIRLVADISHGLRRTSNEAMLEGDTLVVRSSCPLFTKWCEADYRLEVPVGLDLAASVNNGRLVVRDIEGTVEVDGDNGSVELSRLGGNISASTDNGSVVASGLRSAVVQADSDNGRVSLTFAEAPTTVTATTDNGGVEVVLPEGPDTYRVEAHSRHGSTDVGVRTDPSSDRLVTGRTSNGNVTVRYLSG